MTRRNSSVERRCAPASIRSLALVTAGSLTRSGRPTACSPAIQILLAPVTWPRCTRNNSPNSRPSAAGNPEGRMIGDQRAAARSCSRGMSVPARRLLRRFNSPTARTRMGSSVSPTRKHVIAAVVAVPGKASTVGSSTCKAIPPSSSSAGSLSTSWRGRAVGSLPCRRTTPAGHAQPAAMSTRTTARRRRGLRACSAATRKTPILSAPCAGAWATSRWSCAWILARATTSNCG